MQKALLLVISLVFCFPTPLKAQSVPVERKISAPTRLDWEFAARGFPPKDIKLPTGFDSTKHKYLFFVPKGYVKAKPAALVLFISAGERPSGWTYWQKYCDEKNVFFASPYGAGNDTPVGQRVRMVLDVLDDIRRAYSIDPDQTYLTGFSGGGRMACAIGFALPEYFGGVMPLCGTNPLPGPSFQRHFIEDRLPVAFVTGETDFNRKDNEVYMLPWLQEINVHTKLWIMPKKGHVIPSAEIVAAVHDWLAADLDRRRAYRKAHPKFAIAPDEAPTAAEQAKRWLEGAQDDLNDPQRTWRGVSLLQGVKYRWPKSDAAKEADRILQRVGKNATLLKRIEEQATADEVRSLSAQAKALERIGIVPKAIEAWELLADRFQGTPAADSAMANAKRLRGK